MKAFGIIFVTIVAIIAGGCRSTNRPKVTSLPRSPINPSSTAVPLRDPATVANVSYEQSESKNDGTTVRVAAPNLVDAVPSNSTDALGGMTLMELQVLAIENNPTIQAMAATTQKAAGYRTQVGLRPNPIVGYQAVQLGDQGTDQHTLFIERQFIRGGKLELNRKVLNEALRAQRFEFDAQQIRVLTDLEIKFFEVLAAQRRIELITEFGGVVEKGMELSETRFRAQEGTKVDVLQAKIQKNEIDLARQQAAITLTTAWTELAAIVGAPDLPLMHVLGELPKQAEPLDWSSRASEMVVSSPEMQAAHARIARARANLTRQGVQAIPNVTAQIAAGVDNSTNSGLINLQIGAPLPINNRNQGNISAAQAEYCRTVKEAERIELSIKARLAAISREYDSALAAVEQFSREILPSAMESLLLADESYKAGESSFVQVLVARKTFFDSNISFLGAQAQLAQARVRVEGCTLTGALDSVVDESGDDGLRDQALDQQ